MLILTMRDYKKYKKKGIEGDVKAAKITTSSGETIHVILTAIKGNQARVGFECDRSIQIEQVKLRDCDFLHIEEKENGKEHF